MDRGPLSDPRVLEASRDFVCVRLLTYENEQENEFLLRLGTSATGALLNSAFAMLAPDGKTPLCDAGRSMMMSFRRSADPTGALLERMAEIHEEFPGNDEPRHRDLPYLVDARRALNAASADNQALIVVSIRDDKTRTKVESRLASLAWSPEFRGRFAYVRSEDANELSEVTGIPEGSHVHLVRPGVYGLDGEVLASTKRLTTKGLEALFEYGLATYEAHDKGTHVVNQGRRLNIGWTAESLDARNEENPDNSRRARREPGRRRRDRSDDD